MTPIQPAEFDSGLVAEPTRAPIGIRQLRESLSTFVRRAAAGEALVITVDGRPLAKLGPLEPDSPARSLEALAHLGLVEPPRRSSAEQVAPGAVDAPSSPSALPRLAPSDVRVDRLLRQVRG